MVASADGCLITYHSGTHYRVDQNEDMARVGVVEEDIPEEGRG